MGGSCVAPQSCYIFIQILAATHCLMKFEGSQTRNGTLYTVRARRRFLNVLFLHDGQGRLVSERGRASGGESDEPAVQIPRFAQKREGHGRIVALLSDNEAGVLLVRKRLHGGVLQRDNPQRSADLLLRVQDREMLQRRAVHDHVDALLAAVSGDQRDAAALRLRAQMRGLARRQERGGVPGYRHFGRHFHAVRTNFDRRTLSLVKSMHSL